MMNKDDQLKIELFQQSLNQPASFILDLKTGATLPYILIEALKKKRVTGCVLDQRRTCS